MHILGLPVELIILDVDGVILDILGGLRKNLEQAASYFKLALEPIAAILEQSTQGRIRIKGNAHDSTRMMWPHLNEDQTAKFVERFYAMERDCPYAPIEGSLEAISFFLNHVPVALATNNPADVLQWRLAAAGIDRSLFAAIVTKNNVYFKPHPQTFDPIFEAVMVSRERALYVGDLQIDWDTARVAGVMFAAVLTGGVPREAFISEGVPATHVCERLSDILKYTEYIEI